MKVLAPIRSGDELEMLVASGAEELYCGIVPREWIERYTGAIWLNQARPLPVARDARLEMMPLRTAPASVAAVSMLEFCGELGR